MECLRWINEQTTRRDAITTPLGGTNNISLVGRDPTSALGHAQLNMADGGRSWKSPWHGYMNKLGLISSDRYVDNLRLVVLSEDRDP